MSIVAIGIAHLIVAGLMLSARDLVRIAGSVISGVVAIAAAAGSVMIAAGIDPIGRSASGRPGGAGVWILALAAVLYGSAALAAGSRSAED